MESIFEKLWRLGPAAFVLKAILAAMVADGMLLGFILLRRAYRRRYFAKRDARVFELRQRWDALISCEIPYETWRKKPFDRRIIESMALDALEAAGAEESARLLRFLRESGLIEKRIFEARQLAGWRRMRALVALGRTRAPEGIPALAEGLRDRDQQTRLAALRGLGRMACPQAAEEILAEEEEHDLFASNLLHDAAACLGAAAVNGALREWLPRAVNFFGSPGSGFTFDCIRHGLKARDNRELAELYLSLL
jgi:hypothetical protein